MNTNRTSLLKGIHRDCDDESEIVRVLDAYLSCIEAGMPADPDKLLADHPALAAPLRSYLEVMQLADRIADHECQPASPVVENSRLLQEFGDYRVLRQIGRGGMGIVYEAEQQSLKRRVALKVLPLAAAIDPRHLRRFHVESQAAAQLHHTNIVPVYSVGCERGVHYYAMQYIEGKTLAELIVELRQLNGCDAADQAPTALLEEDIKTVSMLASGQLEPREKPPRRDTSEAITRTAEPSPTSSAKVTRSTGASTLTSAYFRTVANLGIQAGEALDHAHQEGVVHRDIKPANLMVDVKGHLWITDFGLARLQNDSGLTLSGDLLGTIRYMSPEQAIGRRAVVDHRTDIYSLGVTLHELLALEPAIDGSDRREVLRRIVEDEPKLLRSINASVPRELETIIQKASAKDPRSRYPTAQELADDLRRFLEHKPLKARRPSPLERIAKWSRRHIAFVVSAASILSVAVVGLAISTAMIASKQTEVTKQRNRARQAIDDLYSDVSQQLLTKKQPDLEAVRRNFLEKALVYYKEFATDRDDTPGSIYRAAVAYRRVADICRNLGRQMEAAEAIRRAIDLYQRTVSHFSDRPAYRDELAHGYHLLGMFLSDMGQLEKSERAYHKAFVLFESLCSEFPKEPQYKEHFARAKADSCYPLRKLGQFDEAEILTRQARDMFTSLTLAFPEEPHYQRLLSGIETDLARLLLDKRRLPEAGELLRECHTRLVQLSGQSPGSPEYLERLRNSLVALGEFHRHAERFAEAEEFFHQALGIAEQAAATTPSPWPKGDIAGIYCGLGSLQMAKGMFEAAEVSHIRRLKIVKEYITAIPALPHHAATLADCHNDIGRVLFAAGKVGDARRSFRDARAHWQRQLLGTPGAQVARRNFARFLADCPDRECREPARGLELAEAVIVDTPKDAMALATLGIARYRAGKAASAIEPLKAAIEVTGGGDATIWMFMTMALARSGEKQQARSWYVKAADWIVNKRPKDQELLALRGEAAAALGLPDAKAVAKAANSSP